MQVYASLFVVMLVTGDSTSKMTVKSVTGGTLRPDGMLRDMQGLCVLTKVSDQALWVG